MLITELDGKGNPADVCLNMFKICVQIQGLLVPIKTEDMGWILGKKLGTVAVSHQNKQIVDEHLRVRVIHQVDQPLRKNIRINPAGTTEEIKFDVKYEKLPNFCLCCGIVGHTAAKFCSIPKEQHKANYSIKLKAPAWGGSV